MFRLLLVVAAVCCAQTHSVVTSQHPRLLQALGDVAKALQAEPQQSLEEAARTSPSPALTSVSVVQDWSLVCKELCGAGLGVAPCANYCATSGVEMSTILGTYFDLAKCEQLQGSQTDPKCNTVESVKKYGSRLCSSYCHQRQRTISGCSPCQLLGVLDEVSKEQGVTTHGSGEGDARQAVQVAKGMEQASEADTDTPDWDEMCKTLCKTGDGGSLCNCDLSPFLI
ncbi:uncharacterized protein LOC6556452 [Drosophila grimshawi]|uniref:GH14563 n=1 Tax=Drosophila grimshawi TaxID=7222 RepID=B4IYX2_DROGR|nr:uncharacterized protein LOC6556452 [Drosophila grimshawi]EDV97680.1 GH14563 [Drosophila grimshawi]